MSNSNQFADRDDAKPNPSSPTQSPRRKSLFGCLGCLGTIICGVLVISAAGYYIIAHTSAPLGMVEAMLESNDGIEIDGLTGTISTGFHIDELRFEDPSIAQSGNKPHKPSCFQNIEFRFNGIGALFQNDRRLIIEEFSVESATVYSHPTSETSASDTLPVDEPQREPAPGQTSRGQVSPFKEVRIDLIQITDFTMIDAESGLESKLGKFSMKDFHYLDGEFKNVGDYEIEGLTTIGTEFECHNFSGNPNSGFHIDRIRIRNGEEQWSSVDKIAFEFNGLEDVMENKRLVIDRIGAESGTFYLHPNQWTFEEDTAAEPETQIAGSKDVREQLKEIWVKEIEIPNMKFINTDTDTDFTVQMIRMKDFHVLESQVTRLGTIEILADYVTFDTRPSTEFPNQPQELLMQHFSAVLQKGLHPRMRRDIALTADCCFAADGTVLTRLKTFDGALQYETDSSQAVIHCNHLKLTDFFDWRENLLPSSINGTLTSTGTHDDMQSAKLLFSPETTIQLGKTVFQITQAEITADPHADHSPGIPFQATADSELRCRMYLLQDDPFVIFELKKQDESSRELFANVFFESSFAGLTPSQQAHIDQNLKLLKNLSVEGAR